MTDQKSKSKNKKKSPFLKWVLIVSVIGALFIGYRYFQAKKSMDERRAAIEEQRQVLIESWETQGLSEEEIQEKLDSIRPSGVPEGERPGGGNGMGIMKVMGGGRGPGNH